MLFNVRMRSSRQRGEEHVRSARELACELLCGVGIPRRTTEGAINLITHGAAPDGSNMKCAVLMSLDRKGCEADHYRNDRASKLSMNTSAYMRLKHALGSVGLEFRAQPIAEALTVASGVVSCEGVLAEVCWSDDPSNPVGRAFFMEWMNGAIVHYLERTPESLLGR